MARRQAPAWQAILERIESQNRMTIEAVELSRTVMDERFQALEGRLDGRFGNLESAVKVMRVSLDRLDGRMGGLEAQIVAREEVLDRRLSLIEAAVERNDRESRARDAALEVSIRELRVSVQELAVEVHELRTQVQQNSAAIRELTTRLEALSRLEERVAALEKRTT